MKTAIDACVRMRASMRRGFRRGSSHTRRRFIRARGSNIRRTSRRRRPDAARSTSTRATAIRRRIGWRTPSPSWRWPRTRAFSRRGWRAIAAALLAYVGAGGHVVGDRGAVRRLARVHHRAPAALRRHPHAGAAATAEAIDAAIRPETRAVHIESITNPLLRVADLDGIAAVCRARGVPLVVDATFATPLLQRPIERGAILSVHSATKYIERARRSAARRRLGAQERDPKGAQAAQADRRQRRSVRGVAGAARAAHAGAARRAAGGVGAGGGARARARAEPSSASTIRRCRRIPITRSPRACSTAAAPWSASRSRAA